MKRLILILSLVFFSSSWCAFAQGRFRSEKDSLKYATVSPKLLDDNFLDTVKVHKKFLINDYSMIGVNYGVTFGNFMFSPSRHNRAYVMCPNYISIMYTHYEKMFGYMYLGLTVPGLVGAIVIMWLFVGETRGLDLKTVTGTEWDKPKKIKEETQDGE